MFVAAPAFSQTKAAAAGPSLYTRLGGYDAIAAVSDDFIARLAADKQLARFLVGISDNSKAHLRQLVVDLLCQATGGPCVYIGRDMKTSHKGLGITGSDWDLSVKALVASLGQVQGSPEGERRAAGDRVEPQGGYRGETLRETLRVES